MDGIESLEGSPKLFLRPLILDTLISTFGRRANIFFGLEVFAATKSLLGALQKGPDIRGLMPYDLGSAQTLWFKQAQPGILLGVSKTVLHLRLE